MNQPPETPNRADPARSNAPQDDATRWAALYARLAAAQHPRNVVSQTPEAQRAILRTRAKLMAQEPLQNQAESDQLEIVTFRMAHEVYAFESRYIREVYPLRDYCPLPCTPAFVFGLINVRGQLLSVLDLKKFFGLASQELDNHNQAIIVQYGRMEVGILADALVDVRHVGRAKLQSALPTLTGLRNEFLLGITPGREIILDAEKLLSSREIIVHEEVEN